MAIQIRLSTIIIFLLSFYMTPQVRADYTYTFKTLMDDKKTPLTYKLKRYDDKHVIQYSKGKNSEKEVNLLKSDYDYLHKSFKYQNWSKNIEEKVKLAQFETRLIDRLAQIEIQYPNGKSLTYKFDRNHPKDNIEEKIARKMSYYENKVIKIWKKDH